MVFSFLYRDNFLSPKHSYVYLVDEDDLMYTKIAIYMSQLFKENKKIHHFTQKWCKSGVKLKLMFKKP